MHTLRTAPKWTVGHAPPVAVTRRRLVGSSLLMAAILLAGCRSQLTSSAPTMTTVPASSRPVSLPSSSPAAPTPLATASAVAPVSPSVATAASKDSGATLTPTDSSVDAEEATPPVTEGPYFKPNSPERTSLLGPDVVGTRLTLSGQVISTRGQPIARALLDFWQADGRGKYDNAGYLLRGHQFSDSQGHYQLVTVIPGLYPGRTRHIHVKVQAPNMPILTTQLYFPVEPGNSTDPLFNSKLLLAMRDAPDGGKLATFNFVLSTG